MASARALPVRLFVIGAGLVALSLAAVRRPGVAPREERAFRAANGAPDGWRVPVRTVMQAGTFGSVPVAAAVAWLAGRRRLAGALAAGGTAAWLLAKAVKPLGGRARPAALLPNVRIRERIAGDLGWPSGHAAVATTLAAVATPGLPSWTRPLLPATVALVGFGRMYVGAHLPWDLVGGTGLGLLVSALADL